MSDDALFDPEPLRVAPAPDPERTAGQRMRDRQATNVALGYHPLAGSTKTLRLHPDAPRVLSKEEAAAWAEEHGDYLRCGTCRFRELVGGHARDFPKCLFGFQRIPLTEEDHRRYPLLFRGATHRIVQPRVSSSETSDVRSWWSACTDWEAKP